MTRSLSPTFVNPLADQYTQPGGPWFELDLPTLLDELPPLDDLICGSGVRLSSDRLRASVVATAGWLRDRGVRSGSAVAWQLPNSPEAVVLYLATWWVGGVAVPFHQTLTAIEAGRVIDAIGGVGALFASPSSPVSSLPGAVGLAPGELLALRTEGEVAGPDARPEAPAILLTTSGSSGTPKTVIHTQRSLAYKARQLPTLHGTTTADSVLVPAPLAHMAGVLHAVLHPLGAGVRAVIMDRWDADEALRLVRDEAVTMLFGPPIFALGIAAASEFTPEAVSSVRLVSSGATAISEAYVHQVEQLYGAKVKRTYGSTEAPVACTTLPDGDQEKGWRTDGRPVPGLELELRSPTDGTPIALPGSGEIWLRGPELCEGYLDLDQTAEAFVDGWFRTRDLCEIDEDGYLTVTGRLSGLIIRGGMNISTSEVEGALERHPAVSQAVVLGYPDDVYGERIAAFVVADQPLDRNGCVSWFAECGLAKYKVPDRIELVEEIPVLSTYQKPDLETLRSML